MGCQEKPTSRRGATDPPFPALYRAAAACPALPRLRPMVSREEGVFNISMGGGFRDRPGACRNVGNPGRSVPPFPPSRRLFRAFNGRRVPSPTRRLLEGWESRPPSPRSRNAPAPSRRPQGGSQKAKEKGHPPGCPSSFTDRTPPDSGYGLLVLTSCYGSGAFPSGSRTPYPQGRRTTRRPP